jgi:CubicO group peptidase (beta-lactamase class C family)
MFAMKKWVPGLMMMALTGCGGALEDGSAQGGFDPGPEAVSPAEATATVSQSLVAPPPTLYAGIFRQGSGGYYLWSGVDWTSFQTKNQELVNGGLRLVDMNIQAASDGSIRYGGAWLPGSGSESIQTGLSWAGFVSHNQTMMSQGQRLVDIEVYLDNGVRRYAGVWRAGSDTSSVQAGLNWDGLISQWQTLAGQGQRLVDLETYLENGERKYAGVWRAGTDGYALWSGVSWSNFDAKVKELAGQGLRLVDMQVYWEGDDWRFTGVFRQGTDGYQVVAGQDWNTFVNTWEAAGGNNLRLVDFQSYVAPPWRSELSKVLDGKAMGYSYAIVESGQITEAGGVGYARAAYELSAPAVPMSAYTRVHLASVSKPITATAMMNVAESYGISIDAPFYPYVKSRWPVAAAGVEKVTLRQLLTHRSGMAAWGYCGDNFTESMRQLLASPMANPTGTYQYSNGNFCLVRAVIESITGMDYVTYVKTYVLQPMGITGMSCKPDAVNPTLYYESGVQSFGYFWSNDYSSQCGAYGWYASATDLAKFLIGIRNNTVLSAATTQTMLSGELGWFDASTAGGTAWHHNGAWITGDGRGCNTGIVRLPNGVEAVLLSNTNGFDTIGTIIKGYNAGPYAL